MDNIQYYRLREIYENPDKELEKMSNTTKEIFYKEFNVEEANKRVLKHIESLNELFTPKTYTFNVVLKGFKEIKRKIVVNSNITIHDSCKGICLSMNADMSHPYCLKFNKKIFMEEQFNIEIINLRLLEKQKLQVIYDFGDNWIFEATLNKIEDGFASKNFEVKSGKGYGIIDDCGGIWGLEDIFDGTDTTWGHYDINDFDLDKCNSKVEDYL